MLIMTMLDDNDDVDDENNVNYYSSILWGSQIQIQLYRLIAKESD